VNLEPLVDNAYHVDPEILATYFLVADLSKEKRDKMDDRFSNALKSSKIAQDILRVS